MMLNKDLLHEDDPRGLVEGGANFLLIWIVKYGGVYSWLMTNK